MRERAAEGGAFVVHDTGATKGWNGVRVLLIGVGTVGEAIARLAAAHPWYESMVLADYDSARAEALQATLGDAERFAVEHIDARDGEAVALAPGTVGT